MEVLQRLIPADYSVSEFGVTVQLTFPFDSCDQTSLCVYTVCAQCVFDVTAL